MTTFPTTAYLTDAARTVAESKQAFTDILNALAELPGTIAESELTIATGTVTPTRAVHSIDTEADAATDDLANIATTNHPDGRLLLIHGVTSARVPTVKHNAGGAGQIALADSVDLVLADPTIWVLLRRLGADWSEVARFDRQARVKGAAIASASTLAVPAVGDYFHVTGTTTVTAMGTHKAGRKATLVMDGAVPFTHHATSLILLGGVSRTTAAGDILQFVSEGAGNWREVAFDPAAQLPLLRGKHTLAITLALRPRVTNGAAEATVESTTNKIRQDVLDFDAAVVEYGQVAFPMPKGWNEGTITAEIGWKASAGTGDAVFAVQAVALSNDDPVDAAFGTAVAVTDTLTATEDLDITPETGAITVGGSPADGDMIVVQVYRDAAAGGDTLNADARVWWVRLFLTINLGNDA